MRLLAHAGEELRDLKDAGAETWRNAAAEFSNAMRELREAYEDLRRTDESNPGRQDTARG